jgi:hypothetical protein
MPVNYGIHARKPLHSHTVPPGCALQFPLPHFCVRSLLPRRRHLRRAWAAQRLTCVDCCRLRVADTAAGESFWRAESKPATNQHWQCIPLTRSRAAALRRATALLNKCGYVAAHISAVAVLQGEVVRALHQLHRRMLHAAHLRFELADAGKTLHICAETSLQSTCLVKPSLVPIMKHLGLGDASTAA